MNAIDASLFGRFVGQPARMWLAFVRNMILPLARIPPVLHREHREISGRVSLVHSALHVVLGLAFGAVIFLAAPLGLEEFLPTPAPALSRGATP